MTYCWVCELEYSAKTKYGRWKASATNKMPLSGNPCVKPDGNTGYQPILRGWTNPYCQEKKEPLWLISHKHDDTVRRTVYRYPLQNWHNDDFLRWKGVLWRQRERGTPVISALSRFGTRFKANLSNIMRPCLERAGKRRMWYCANKTWWFIRHPFS